MIDNWEKVEIEELSTENAVVVDTLTYNNTKMLAPQLVRTAREIIRQYCRQQNGCDGCALYQTCAHNFSRTPNLWPEEVD